MSFYTVRSILIVRLIRIFLYWNSAPSTYGNILSRGKWASCHVHKQEYSKTSIMSLSWFLALFSANDICPDWCLPNRGKSRSSYVFYVNTVLCLDITRPRLFESLSNRRTGFPLDGLRIFEEFRDYGTEADSEKSPWRIPWMDDVGNNNYSVLTPWISVRNGQLIFMIYIWKVDEMSSPNLVSKFYIFSGGRRLNLTGVTSSGVGVQVA